MANHEIQNNAPAQEQAPALESRVQKHIVIGTWAMSRGEPCLFYWRDPNSYNNDLYLTGDISSRTEINEVARAEVAKNLVFEGIDEKRAGSVIKRVEKSGQVVIPFPGENWDSEWKKRRAPMVFVEVMPSVLHELTKKAAHLLLPAWVIKPNPKWDDASERSIKKAFKKFAVQKSSTK